MEDIINKAYEHLIQFDKIKQSMTKSWNIDWGGEIVEVIPRKDRFEQCLRNSFTFLTTSNKGPKVNLSDVQIVGSGYYNIVFRIDGKLFRMSYTMVSDNFIYQAITAYELLMSNNDPTYFGVLRPRHMWVSDPKLGHQKAFMIYELLEAEPLNGYTYDELYDLCKRLLKLSNSGLCNSDIHWDNLMRYNNQLVNIDLDLLNIDAIKILVNRSSMYRDKSIEELKELIKPYLDKGRHDDYKDCVHILEAICFNTNEATCENWMLWCFNVTLYKMKWNIPIYTFITTSKFLEEVIKNPLHFGGL